MGEKEKASDKVVGNKWQGILKWHRSTYLKEKKESVKIRRQEYVQSLFIISKTKTSCAWESPVDTSENNTS